MNYTQHAKTRMQQRTIPPLVVNWLMEFGAVEYTRGCQKRFFDKPARKRLRKAVGAEIVDRLGDLLDSYIVVSADEHLITAAPRNKRIWRH